MPVDRGFGRCGITAQECANETVSKERLETKNKAREEKGGEGIKKTTCEIRASRKKGRKEEKKLRREKNQEGQAMSCSPCGDGGGGHATLAQEVPESSSID
jgi:hypothetical protein